MPGFETVVTVFFVKPFLLTAMAVLLSQSYAEDKVDFQDRIENLYHRIQIGEDISKVDGMARTLRRDIFALLRPNHSHRITDRRLQRYVRSATLFNKSVVIPCENRGGAVERLPLAILGKEQKKHIAQTMVQELIISLGFEEDFDASAAVKHSSWRNLPLALVLLRNRKKENQTTVGAEIADVLKQTVRIRSEARLRGLLQTAYECAENLASPSLGE